MTPLPLVLGVTLCEKAIVEAGTSNISLVSTFSRLVVEQFPSMHGLAHRRLHVVER